MRTSRSHELDLVGYDDQGQAGAIIESLSPMLVTLAGMTKEVKELLKNMYVSMLVRLSPIVTLAIGVQLWKQPSPIMMAPGHQVWIGRSLCYQRANFQRRSAPGQNMCISIGADNSPG